jgi:preprotein translocase subunit SecB
MTDTPPMPAPGAPQPQPQIRILAQFIRDLSFENPNAPESLRATETPPNIDLGVEMNAKGRPDGFYEVDLKLTARAQRSEGTVFQVELLYGGLFELNGFSEDQLELILLIECPRFLFPFARRIIADLTAEGGYPPLHLEPIDFAAVYAAQRAQAGDFVVPQVGHA